MNDRELLELAAKAAGVNKVRDGLYANPCRSGERIWWAPLIDDGDALRLAVKLNLDIRFDSAPDGVSVEACGMWDNAPCGRFETFEKEGFAATRRAIVRAAAEIGKAMP